MKTWFTHGNLTGSNSYISMPSSRSFSMCERFSGRLLESLPNPSKSARTSTPSFAFMRRRSNSSDAIESLRKLKYSRCTLLLACRMASNISSNFSCPEVSSVTLLLWVNTTACLITVSLLCNISDTAISKGSFNTLNSFNSINSPKNYFLRCINLYSRGDIPNLSLKMFMKFSAVMNPTLMASSDRLMSVRSSNVQA